MSTTMTTACLFFDKTENVEKAAELFTHFSPQIAVRPGQAIFIEIGKCANLYSAEEFQENAHVILNKFGFSARVAIGVDATDALAMGRYKVTTISELPLQALMDFTDPFDKDENLRRMVATMIESFSDLGVRTVGHFNRIPTGQLVARFGQLGRFCQLRTQMKDFVAWPVWKPEEIIFEKKEFPYFEFYGELDPLLFELKTQVDRIFARLARRERRVTKLRVQVKCEKLSVHPHFLRTFDFDFFVPQSLPKGTLKIIKERLTREFEKAPILSPIEALKTTVLKSVPYRDGQKNFFNNDEERTEQLYSIHNQLGEILGKENTFQAQLTEDRRPEKSWTKVYDDPHTKHEVRADFHERLPERPTYLLPQPVPIEVAAGCVRIQKRRYEILQWDNQVEIVTGGWFEEPAAKIQNTYQRHYFMVTLKGHQRVLIFKEREYYLHGYYG